MHAEVVARRGIGREPALAVGAESVPIVAANGSRLEPTATIASGMGRPVSAARTRPSTIVAGWRASVTSFGPVAIVGPDAEPLAGEAGVADVRG